MKKDDEIQLWKEIWKIKKAGKRPYFREVAEKLNINPNRAWYIFQKWCDKGLANCGISPMAGWIEEEITEEDLK